MLKRRLRSQTDLFHFSSFILNYGFIEEYNPSEKVVVVEEELNHVDIDDIGHLKNRCSSTRNVGISKKSVMVESLLQILNKKRSRRFTVAC